MNAVFPVSMFSIEISPSLKITFVSAHELKSSVSELNCQR
jgi:hypothetical protein